MDDRFTPRLREMLEEAVLSPTLVPSLLNRRREFIAPFAAALSVPEQRKHVGEYVSGLLSPLDRKTGESIAYLHEQERQGIQKFIGYVPWDHRPLLAVLAERVGRSLGEADGVLVFDPSAFAKKGTKSVGVGRQWSGRQGKVDNCQVGVYLGYVSREGHALVDFRLYLPKEWTTDRKRCQAAGVPKGVRFQTRHEQALEMLDGAGRGLPHRWVAGDDEMGRSSGFRQELRARGEYYLLAVPSNTRVRDEEAEVPAYGGRGRRPRAPFERVDRWAASLPASAWATLDVRDGEKGPLCVEAVCCRVKARAGQKIGPGEILFVTRERIGDEVFKLDYYLSHAPGGTSLAEFARVAKAAHEIEACFQQGKSEAGLGDYQVRNWVGWHHHQTLALIASWFLTAETRRGEKRDACADGAAPPGDDRLPAGREVGVQHAEDDRLASDALDAADRDCEILLASRA